MKKDAVNILVVDDIRENLSAMAALLQSENMTVHLAPSGAAALELLLEFDFALAIVDVQMPEMTGFELAELMRSSERTKRIPIVFVTAASHEINHAFRGYESGGIDFLYKPLDNHSVLSKVNVFAEMYRQRRALSEQVVALEQARAEQEKLLNELQQTQQQLEQAIASRDSFMSIVSHELRTPLNTFRLEYYMRRQYLENGDMEAFTPEKIGQMIDIDERQLERLLRLINDIMDVSRIRTGQLSVRPAEIDLAELVKKVVKQFSYQISVARCTAQVHAENAITGQWDEFRLEQVIANLLLNAMRHGTSKAIDISVERCGENNVRLSITDQGGGIPAEDQLRIFEQFARGAGARKGSGLGLGLFISDQIIQAHGGRIYICSAPGEGATFSVNLPRYLPSE